MLTAYYSRGCDSRELFQGLKIATHPDFEKHLNQYNVIHLNMQSFLSKTQTIEQMIALVTKAVGRDLLRAYPDIDYLDKFIWLCEKISVNSTTVIKNDIVERLEKQPLNFFTVYNKYRNLLLHTLFSCLLLYHFFAMNTSSKFSEFENCFLDKSGVVC